MRQITSDAWIERLSGLAQLDADDRAVALGALGSSVSSFPAGSVLQQQQQHIVAPHLLISGWAWRTRNLPTGREQVVAIVLPGDFIGLCWRPKPRALSATVAVTKVTIRPVGGLLSIMRAEGRLNPTLREALTLTSRHDEMRLLDHVVRLGSQPAIERVVGLFLELHARLSAVGMTTPDGFDMPLTQDQLGKMLGLSLVHVNRTLQELRREGLLEFKQGRVTFRSREVLVRLCGFDAVAQAYAESI